MSQVVVKEVPGVAGGGEAVANMGAAMDADILCGAVTDADDEVVVVEFEAPNGLIEEREESVYEAKMRKL